MRKIKLTQNKFAIVDDDDFTVLNKYKWYTFKSGKNFYAARNLKLKNGKFKTILMHKIIMNTPNNKDTDHIDGDGLNNCRENLRICTRSENLMNQGKQKSNKSGFKGVSWNSFRKKWVARIYFNNKNKQLGYFKNKVDAYKAYCDACIKYHGKFYKLS